MEINFLFYFFFYTQPKIVHFFKLHTGNLMGNCSNKSKDMLWPLWSRRSSPMTHNDLRSKCVYAIYMKVSDRAIGTFRMCRSDQNSMVRLLCFGRRKKNVWLLNNE